MFSSDHLHARLRFALPRAIAGAVLLLAWAQASAFGFIDVAAKARALAGQGFEEPPQRIPDFLLQLADEKGGYDRYRDIRFKPAESLWRAEKLPFQVQMFHPGLYFTRAVQINVIDGDSVSALPFSVQQFDYGKNADYAARIPADMGYAGFRVHTQLNTPDYFDELAVFLGASYFRALGKGQLYGLSARGLALDTALPHGEEFPFFREFWLAKPAADAKTLTLYALLDSQRVTGAYEFVLHPGESTRIDVQAEIFMREAVDKVGLAPLTSMFLYGTNSGAQYRDFRPQVHDSDGLLVHSAGGEWLWRPLQNPRRLLVNAFDLPGLAGFGLLQRAREFDDYEDLEARYELRPGLWIAPRGDWGPGRVELIQIPTNSEVHDNIVAFWVPQAPLEKGRALHVAYEMRWLMNGAGLPPGAKVNATRITPAGGAAAPNAPEQKAAAQKIVLDFIGGRLPDLAADAAVQPVLHADGGAIADVHHQKHPVTGGWRVVFEVRPAADSEAVELRAFLRLDEDVLSETWSYALIP